jgi:hypothetical protein
MPACRLADETHPLRIDPIVIRVRMQPPDGAAHVEIRRWCRRAADERMSIDIAKKPNSAH